MYKITRKNGLWVLSAPMGSSIKGLENKWSIWEISGSLDVIFKQIKEMEHEKMEDMINGHDCHASPDDGCKVCAEYLPDIVQKDD